MAQENCIAAVVLQFRATTLTVSVMFKTRQPWKQVDFTTELQFPCDTTYKIYYVQAVSWKRSYWQWT